jgi:hypothetical protein
MDPEALHHQRRKTTLSDGTNEQPQQEEQAAQQPPFLVINVTPNGLNVQTNVKNPIMLYGLLEAAKDSVRQHTMQKEEPLIARPTIELPPGLRIR